MPATRTVTVCGRPVAVRELTVREVRDWLAKVEAGESCDPVHALALEDFNFADLGEMIDVPLSDIEHAPSDLAELIAAGRELNPHFFRVRAAVNNAARRVIAESEAMTSIASRAPWWSAAMRWFGRIRSARS